MSLGNLMCCGRVEGSGHESWCHNNKRDGLSSCYCTGICVQLGYCPNGKIAKKDALEFHGVMPPIIRKPRKYKRSPKRVR
ncbi:MAG: hypothetical protein KAS32_07210 [Candidatus Peribacteraceae bacterium]|nr:hypothetical protein [Candidatus Peribacteraceae bacterium]